jgi:hypothetical protein
MSLVVGTTTVRGIGRTRFAPSRGWVVASRWRTLCELRAMKEPHMTQEQEQDQGVVPESLSDRDLLRELEQLHRTRHEAFLHGPTEALQHHSERTAALELEYLRRYPERDIKPR